MEMPSGCTYPSSPSPSDNERIEAIQAVAFTPRSAVGAVYTAGMRVPTFTRLALGAEFGHVTEISVFGYSIYRPEAGRNHVMAN